VIAFSSVPGAPPRLCRLSVAAALLAAPCASSVASAQEQPTCASLGSAEAPIVYGRGGSAPNQLLGKLAVEIKKSSEPLTVIYKDDGACFAMESLVNGQKLLASAKYWVEEGGKVVQKTCTLPAEDGPTATWGSMAQQATTCPGVTALPADIRDEIGPVSGFSLIVPNASTQQAISAEAVFYIYGFGVENPATQVEPWIVPGAIGSRKTTSAAGLLLAKAASIPLSHSLYRSGVPGDDQNDVKNNQGAVDWITTKPAATANPEAALAFCSTETADANRDKVRTLAFQATGQDYAYWPDSNATTSFDKINIREGRYYLWNPHHFYTQLGEDGEPIDENTARWVGYLTGNTALPAPLNYLDIQIGVGVVPQCAMRVNRDDDVGPLYSWQPDEPCGCYFELKATGAAPAECVACTEANAEETCPDSAPVCRHGFCEVK
jgi:hypothetical protein